MTVASEDKGLALAFETRGFGGVPAARTERDDEGALRSEEARDVESDWGGADPGVDAREIRLRLSSSSWVRTSETLQWKKSTNECPFTFRSDSVFATLTSLHAMRVHWTLWEAGYYFYLDLGSFALVWLGHGGFI